MSESKLDLIEQWLLSDTLMPSAPAAWAGGVPGWWIEGKQPEWVYLEITGYYLTTLAFIALRSPHQREIAIAKARHAVDWMNRVVTPTHLPPTRLYAEADHDWRNRATFSFDLGMALRGVAAVEKLVGAPATQAVDQLLRHLETFVGEDNVIESHRMLDGSSPDQLEPKWSTRRGPHHVKVAGAIALATKDSHWQRIARTTTQFHLTHQSAAQGDLHPCAYFLEGLMQMSVATSCPSLPNDCARVFRNAIASRPTQPREGLERADVTAQFLRLHSMLENKHAAICPKFGEEQAVRLNHFLAPDGSFRFHQIGSDSQRATHVNTWATMFAYQAIAFHEAALTQAHVPSDWIRLII
jgi:hypothetical protein